MKDKWITVFLYQDKPVFLKNKSIKKSAPSLIKIPPGAELFYFTKHKYIYLEQIEDLNWSIIKKIIEKYKVDLKEFVDWFYIYGKKIMNNNIQQKFYDKESYLKNITELDLLALENKTNNSLLSFLNQENIKLF